MMRMQFSPPKPNLNTATKKDLQAVEQIGPKLSQALLDEMPFPDWGSVQRVPGIGPTRLANLQSVFCLDSNQCTNLHDWQTPVCSQSASGNCSASERNHTEWESCSMTSNSSYIFCGSGYPETTDLNSISEQDLQKVPGIGPKIASAVCRSRPFMTWGDVAKVPLVGPKRLEALQSMLSLGSGYALAPKLTVYDQSGMKPKAQCGPKDHGHSFCTLAAAEDGSRQCFLPETVFRGLDGQAVRVYELQKGNFVCGGDGKPLEVTHCRTLPKARRGIVIMQVDDIELRVPSSNRVVVQRGSSQKAAAPASTLRLGDDLFCSGDEVKKLTGIESRSCEVELHEIEFNPNKDVEAFTLQQLPEKTILVKAKSPTRTRRSGVAERSKPAAARTPSPTQRLRQAQPQ